MASISGIRASGSGTSEYMKKIVLKDAASYGPWRTKLTSILDAEDCMEIVTGNIKGEAYSCLWQARDRWGGRKDDGGERGCDGG